jgi:membrane-bound lytic murein transglycosylase D
MNLDLAARFAGLPLEQFQQLNPQMNKPVILAAAMPQVLLPYDNASEFATQLANHAGPMSSWTAWVVPKTMAPAEAAKRAGMSEASLRELNKIPPRMLVKAGSTLLVSRAAHDLADVSERLADTASLALTPDSPPLRRTVLKAGKADTVASVAARYKLKPEQVAQWNKLAPNARFKPGQQVVVYTAPVPAPTRMASASKPAAKVAAKPVKTGAKSRQVVAAAQL